MATLISSNADQGKKVILGDAITRAVAGIWGVMALDQVVSHLYNREDSAVLAKEKVARREIGSDEVDPRKINSKLKLDLTSTQTNRLFSVICYGLGPAPAVYYGSRFARSIPSSSGLRPKGSVVNSS